MRLTYSLTHVLTPLPFLLLRALAGGPIKVPQNSSPAALSSVRLARRFSMFLTQKEGRNRVGILRFCPHGQSTQKSQNCQTDPSVCSAEAWRLITAVMERADCQRSWESVDAWRRALRWRVATQVLFWNFGPGRARPGPKVQKLIGSSSFRRVRQALASRDWASASGVETLRGSGAFCHWNLCGVERCQWQQAPDPWGAVACAWCRLMCFGRHEAEVVVWFGVGASSVVWSRGDRGDKRLFDWTPHGGASCGCAAQGAAGDGNRG